MTVTTPTNVDTSVPEIWAKKVFRSHAQAGFWGPFIGEQGKAGTIIVQNSELLGSPGDLIHFQVTNPLSGAGVTGDTAKLEGNEENLSTSEFKLDTVLNRHAVRSYRRANKRSIIELREEASYRLAEWGQDKMDRNRWSQFTSTNDADVPGGGYSAPNIKFVNDRANDAALVAGDKVTVDTIRRVRAKLRAQKARPYKLDGRDIFFMVMHPYQAYDLKQDATYNTAVQNAAARGSDNPVFTGMLAMIDGVALFEHFNVPTVVGTGGIKLARSLAFGQEAFIEALDENVSWDEEKFDYGNEIGVAYSYASKARRALELSSLQLRSAMTDLG